MRVSFVLFAMLFAGVSASAATDPAQFNLVCSGTLTTESLALGKKSEPYSYTYRFDLKSNKYCEGECKATRAILRVDPTVITLADEKTDTPSERSIHAETIDRETGRHYILRNTDSNDLGIMLMKWEGQCEKAPFTGFPEFKTKF
jgi:hypothetical protein